MSENKCPFCGEAMMTTEDKIMLCENSDCATMFNEWDYPKVAAAMELAKTKQKRETIGRNIFGDWDEYDEKLWQAERRVLEVFNAK
jgi:hypothetical protein